MSERLSGKIDCCICWCPYHDMLIGFLNYEKRIEEIIQTKLTSEVPIRLKEFVRVRNKLPQEVVEACWNLYQATMAYEQALMAYDQASTALGQAWVVLSQAWTTYDQMWMTYKQIIAKNKDYLENLHKQEVPDTSWNGEKIAFQKE